MNRSSKARNDLTCAAYSRQDEVRTHMVSQNTAHEGLITWMKPGVNFQMDPQPINLKEALSYLMERESYQSTGQEVLDFYTDDVDIQFKIIMKILFPSRYNVVVQNDEPQTRSVVLFVH